MIKPPKEININDFKYFIVVKGLLVAGVYAEDEDNIYSVVIKGDGEVTKKGAVLSNTKENIVNQVESGITIIVKTYEEAYNCEVSDSIPVDVIQYVKGKRDGKK